MAKNSNLHAAKVAKNDEFYTMLTDIEKEMSHYKDFFKGKVVYCNCDDARESNFFNPAETVVKGYVLSVLDIIEESEVIFTGTPAEDKPVTWDSSTKKFVVGN